MRFGAFSSSMQKELYAHFHADEHAFVDRAWEWIERAAEHHSVKRSDFLDPRQCYIVASLANRYDVNLRFDGGYEGAERKRAIIVPDYRDPAAEDVGIAVLAVESHDAKFAELEHGDFLGAILGLGVKREKIGDIHVLGHACHCLVASEIAEFFDLHLKQVHRVQVTTQLLPLHKLQTASVRLEEIVLSVASMRLDGIVSDAVRLSRAKVLPPIKAGRCRVNWKVEEDPSAPLREGDVVSLQGFGRFKVLAVEGTTKSGRTRVRIGKYI